MAKKEHLTTKINVNKDNPEIFEPNQTVFTKKHIRQKNADKFNKPTKIVNVDTAKKTAKLESQEKIHLSNIKRPLKNKYSFD